MKLFPLRQSHVWIESNVNGNSANRVRKYNTLNIHNCKNTKYAKINAKYLLMRIIIPKSITLKAVVLKRLAKE